MAPAADREEQAMWEFIVHEGPRAFTTFIITGAGYWFGYRTGAKDARRGQR